jgi:hypothetical protein
MNQIVEDLLTDIKIALDKTAKEINPCFTRDYIGLDDTIDTLVTAVRADERQQLLATSVIQFPMGSGQYAMMRVSDLTQKEAPAPAIARLAEIIADAILPQDPSVEIITRAGTAPADEQPEDEDTLFAGLDATETEGEL